MIYEPEEAQIILMSIFFRELNRRGAYALEQISSCKPFEESKKTTMERKKNADI